jgi:dipeptidyl aminopeptidase/acylaminoacyl peptidase
VVLLAKNKSVEVKDLFKLRLVSNPQISPDGKRIVFVHTVMNYAKDEYLNDIWMADVKTGALATFTSGRGSDKNPYWSPDGKQLLFTSTPPVKDSEEKKKPQLYIMPVDGGEARKLTDLKFGVEAPKWSSDGKKILFINPTRPVETKNDVKNIIRLSYKFNGRGFYNGIHKHVFTISLKGGKPNQITQGEFDVQSAEWLGKSIIFIGNTEPDAEKDGYEYIYLADAKGKPKRLLDGTWKIDAFGVSPSWKQIVFSGHDYRKGDATKNDLWVMSSEGGTPKKITVGFEPDLGVKISSDVRVSSPDSTPFWHSDGHIYFSSNFAGISYLNRIKEDGGTVEQLLGQLDHSVEAWSINSVGAITYTTLAVTKPSDLWVKSDGNTKQLTDFNRRWLYSLDLHSHERIEFKSSGGHTVEGWIMKPSGFRSGKKYPMVVEIHGGPRGVFGNALMHEHQVLAGQGWGVMYVNPWGSGGYTEDYQAGLPGHYGEQDYADIMEACDYCIKNFNWIDGERLACLGGSYGGFMTNWIVTHTTRFKAAVTMRSISNWISFFGTSDIGWTFGKREMLGLPWDHEEEFMAKSPIRYVKNVKTPTLVIHSEEDYRCPIEQGEQFYTALKYLNVPTEFLRFPGENHELSRSGKPKHREIRLENIIRWFKKYL